MLGSKLDQDNGRDGADSGFAQEARGVERRFMHRDLTRDRFLKRRLKVTCRFLAKRYLEIPRKWSGAAVIVSPDLPGGWRLSISIATARRDSGDSFDLRAQFVPGDQEKTL
jgi:hypothetical protein